MDILTSKLSLKEIKNTRHIHYFSDMIKAVVDIERQMIAIDAEYHADLEELLKKNGSIEDNLYGLNIFYENNEIQFESLINIRRNRKDGFPRGGMIIADELVQNKVRSIVHKWIEF